MRTSRLIGTALATIGLASAATVLPVNPAISTAAAATPQSIWERLLGGDAWTRVQGGRCGLSELWNGWPAAA